jgi:hypothetical protein
VALSDTLNHPFHVGLRHLSFFDLRVYRGAGRRVIHDTALYRPSILRHLGFTYPPFAAFLFSPLDLFSLAFDRVAVTLASVATLVWALKRTIGLKRPGHARGEPIGQRPAPAWALAASATAVALWLEPITVTLGYGQIDIFISALVVFDLARPDSARGKGIGIGLAAAIKLTPLLFIVYLLCSRRRRAAMVAVITFMATVALSFALMPADAERYWTKVVFHSSRVGGAPDAANQSLRGALARLLAERHPGAAVVVACLAVAAIGLLLAVRSSRHGDEATGFSLCAITMLLVSPVSWTHHWTIAVPALLLLAVVAYEQRRLALALAAGLALAVGYAYLPERQVSHRGHRLLIAHQALHGGLHTLGQDPYVLLGLLALAVPAAGLAKVRRARANRSPWRRSPLHIARISDLDRAPDNVGAATGDGGDIDGGLDRAVLLDSVGRDRHLR